MKEWGDPKYSITCGLVEAIHLWLRFTKCGIHMALSQIWTVFTVSDNAACVSECLCVCACVYFWYLSRCVIPIAFYELMCQVPCKRFHACSVKHLYIFDYLMLCRMVFVKVSPCAVRYNFMVRIDCFTCCISCCQSSKEDDVLFIAFLFCITVKIISPVGVSVRWWLSEEQQ